MNWIEMRERLAEAKATRSTLKKEIGNLGQQLVDKDQLIEDLTECLSLIQLAAQETQNILKTDVENIVSSALAAIPFKHQYEFSVQFVPRRNTTECDLLFTRSGHDLEPLESSGFGAADVASFALRIAYWKLNRKLRNFMAIDEPFSNLDKEKHIYAADMLRSISEEFQIQFLISSHEPTLIACADKVFRITQKNDKAIIEVEE